MSRRLAAILIVASALLIVTALLLLARSFGRGDRGPATPAAEGSATTAEGELETVDLYFPGPGGLLYREPREILRASDPVATARNVVTALLEGPRTESLLAAFPESTTVRAVDPGAAGSLYVSLDSPDHPRLNLGSRGELLMIYSLVDSVAFNVEGIDRVAVLWNGTQPATLAGHVDTSHPLPPSRTWVATDAQASEP